MQIIGLILFIWCMVLLACGVVVPVLVENARERARDRRLRPRQNRVR